MITFLLCVCLGALGYCAYRNRKLKSNVAIAVGTSTIFLDYITEQRGAFLHLVVDSLRDGVDPPQQASDLEIKVATIIMSFPKSREEMDMIRDLRPRANVGQM